MSKKLVSLLLLLVLCGAMWLPAVAENLDYFFVATFDASPKFYTGPGTNYLRANGNAQYGGGGEARVFGREGRWILMGYQTRTGNYRIGYIPDNNLSKMHTKIDDWRLKDMRFEYRTAYISSSCEITDDPLLKYAPLGTLERGQSCVYLASFDDRWAYIELTMPSENKKARGFVPMNNVTFSYPVTDAPYHWITPTPRVTPPPTMPPVDYSTGFCTTGIWATANQQLITRTGPGYQYTDCGTMYLANQPVYCLAKHYDYSSQVWWVLFRISDGSGAQYLWTPVVTLYNSDWLISRLPED